MRTLEVQTPNGSWQKIHGQFKGVQQVYNAILQYENAHNIDGVYRITTYAADQRVAVRQIRACDARPARGKSRHTRPKLLTGKTEGPLASLATLVNKLESGN